MSKVDWKWKRRIEEMREFKYLGYMMQRNERQEVYMKERVAKEAVVGQVWSIRKKKFGRDWKKKIWLFHALAWTVASYGVEIWEEREEIERVHKRFPRWDAGVFGEGEFAEGEDEELSGKNSVRI